VKNYTITTRVTERFEDWATFKYFLQKLAMISLGVSKMTQYYKEY
jgi:hypothetical protein